MIRSIASRFGTGSGPGMAEAHRARVRVGLRPEHVRTRAEHLRRRGELDVALEPDHRFVVGHRAPSLAVIACTRGSCRRSARYARRADVRTSGRHDTAHDDRRGWTVLGALYFVWGTTYLGHREGQRDDADLARRGDPVPVRGHGAVRVRPRCGPASARRRSNGAPPASSACSCCSAGTRSVAVSENMGTPTSIVALIIALIPLWLAFFDRVVFRSSTPRLEGGRRADRRVRRCSAARRAASAASGVPLGGMLVAVARHALLDRRLAVCARAPRCRRRHCSAAACSNWSAAA